MLSICNESLFWVFNVNIIEYKAHRGIVDVTTTILKRQNVKATQVVIKLNCLNHFLSTFHDEVKNLGGV